MYHWLVRRAVRRAYGQLNSRDVSAVTALFGSDSKFHFPGDHALSGDYRGRREIGDFFARLWELFPGLEFSVSEVVVKGPPWNMTAFVHYHDAAVAPNGAAWRGQGLQHARLRWGKMVDDFIVNDTQAVCEYLRHAWPELDAPAPVEQRNEGEGSR